MMPYLSPGESVLVLTVLKIKKGDVVVFKYNAQHMIKRVTQIQDNDVFVEGDNKRDSLAIGKISKRDIMGKVLFKI